MAIYTKEEQYKLIRNTPINLYCIDNQYEDVCLEAVKQDGLALQYVKKQTSEICLEAVKQDSEALEYVKEQTPEICFYAFLSNYGLLRYKDIKSGVDKFIKSNKKIKNSIFMVQIDDCIYDTDGMDIDDIDFYYFLIKDEIKTILKYEDISDYLYSDIRSIKYAKDFLIKENMDNHFIFSDNIDDDLLKYTALSNNELIIVDNGNIRNNHKLLSNKIIELNLYN